VSRRGAVAVAVLLAWLGGLAVLVRREYFRPQVERLAEAALRINPGAVYYVVSQGNRQIGFASSTIDTAEAAITVSDYFVADLPVGGRARRATARTNVTLSRALRVRNFDLAVETEAAPLRAAGQIIGDSVLLLTIATGAERPDTQRVALSGPILLPTLLPLAVALGEKPKVGKRYVLPVFDPASMRPKDVALEVRAESMFVVNDSSVFDAGAARWRGVQPDTLHAWQIAADAPGGFSGWVDEQGRIVQTTQLGFDLRRQPYEVAFENWRLESARGVPVTEDRDILESTAIAANKRLTGRVSRLRARLSNVDLKGFDLDGGRQTLRGGDTLIVTEEPPAALEAKYARPPGLNTPDTKPEPLLQSDAPEIVSLANRIARDETDPRKIAAALTAWVYDSLKKRVTFSVPSALQVARTLTGDCNEHTQLYVALARALRIPARVAAGLAYVDGKFYYHAWPEVYLGDWVAVDPTFGQFPADAAHLRFVLGGLNRQAELLRLMGNLKIDVLEASGERPGARQGRAAANGNR
jgi:hypothetical protein